MLERWRRDRFRCLQLLHLGCCPVSDKFKPQGRARVCCQTQSLVCNGRTIVMREKPRPSGAWTRHAEESSPRKAPLLERREKWGNLFFFSANTKSNARYTYPPEMWAPASRVSDRRTPPPKRSLYGPPASSSWRPLPRTSSDWCGSSAKAHGQSYPRPHS